MLYYKIINNTSNKDKSPWMIMLHGIGGNINIFKKQIDILAKDYNLLLIDLHGHGNSANIKLSDIKKIYGEINFQYVCKDIIELLDYLNIEKFHIMGISLGTIIALQMEKYYEDRILSMILGGAIIGMTLKSISLLYIGNISKYIMPRKLFYRIVAYISMPSKRHKTSRNIFLKASRSLEKRECCLWTDLMTYHLKNYKYVSNTIRKIFILGDEDHVFLPTIKKCVPKEDLVVLKNCGHICNIDSYKEFNRVSIKFLREYPNVVEIVEINKNVAFNLAINKV